MHRALQPGATMALGCCGNVQLASEHSNEDHITSVQMCTLELQEEMNRVLIYIIHSVVIVVKNLAAVIAHYQ
jgi:hypothetical protein